MIVLAEVLDDPGHDMATMGFSSVKSRLDVDYMFLFVSDGPGFSPFGKGELVNVQSTQALTDNLLAIVKIVIRNLEAVRRLATIFGCSDHHLVLGEELAHLALTLLVLDKLGLQLARFSVHGRLTRLLDLLMLHDELANLLVIWVVRARSIINASL